MQSKTRGTGATGDRKTARDGTAFRGQRVAHKYGSYGTSFGDAGIVFREDGKQKHYFVVVLSDGSFEADARDVMQQAAAAAHREISGSVEDISGGEQHRRSGKRT